MSNTETTLPEITPAMLKAAGLNCWQSEFMGQIGQKFTAQGYTFDQWRGAVRRYCYYSSADGGIVYVRLRPQYDPEAHPCPHCDDPGIVMQPVGKVWRCPKCGRMDQDHANR